MGRKVEYNRSANVERRWECLRRRCDGSGRTKILIRCPFCLSEFWAYVWSLCGGGKKCENLACGALHGSTGGAVPVVGREPE